MLEVDQVSVSFESVQALSNITMTARRERVTAVMGPSGCGKTTLLRVVAGLETPDTGSVIWDGRTLDGLRPDQRRIGLMFQDHALFPHRNVFGNVAFGLEMQKLGTSEIKDRVGAVLALVGMEPYGERSVDRLSGGEQQRVALARALAPEPNLLMLDEPLGSLDRTMRDEMLGDMRELFTSLGITVIYVTHDRDEVFTIADDLVVMDAGRVLAAGAADVLWLDPGTEKVARFLGHPNILSLVVAHGTVHIADWGVPMVAPDGPVEVLIAQDAIRHDANGTIAIEVISSHIRAGIHTSVGRLSDGQELTYTGGPSPIGSAQLLTIDRHRMVRLDGG